MITITAIDELNDAWPQDACYCAGLMKPLKHIKRWTRPTHYFGAEWSEYYSAGIGRSRDSDCLERSNFVQMLEALGGDSDKADNVFNYGAVRVVTENHWAVGWVEWIAIHQSNYAALAIADKLMARLEDYLILNEEHFSELEQEEANDIWRECYSPRERVAYIQQHRSQFDFHDWRDLRACVRGDYFAGYAGDLIHA